MVSNVSLPIDVGSEFQAIFEQSDGGNLAIDAEVESYLKSNPEGLVFSYSDKSYLLKMDQVSLAYQLYRAEGNNLVLVDSNVQIKSKFTPDGFIEIGGLVSGGDRIFIGRSPDSDQEEIIAFVERHDISSVSSKPTDATVLYGGKPVVTNEVEESTGVEQTPSTPILGAYAWFSELPDGEYYSDGTSLFLSNGELLADCVYPEGNYKILESQGYQQHVTTGGTIYLPVDTYNGGYVMSGVYKNQDGASVAGSKLSFEFLTGLGISVDQIDVPYVFPALQADNIEFTVGPLDSADGGNQWENFVFVDGKVLGRSSYDDVGEYFVRDGITYKTVASAGSVSGLAVDPFDGLELQS